MRAVGIILAGGNSSRMKELTAKRAIAAEPIAGSYRSIDFALSYELLQVVGLRTQAGRTLRIPAGAYAGQQLVVPRNGGLHLSEYRMAEGEP